jgi:hypothetical protein
MSPEELTTVICETTHRAFTCIHTSTSMCTDARIPSSPHCRPIGCMCGLPVMRCRLCILYEQAAPLLSPWAPPWALSRHSWPRCRARTCRGGRWPAANTHAYDVHVHVCCNAACPSIAAQPLCFSLPAYPIHHHLQALRPLQRGCGGGDAGTRAWGKPPSPTRTHATISRSGLRLWVGTMASGPMLTVCGTHGCVRRGEGGFQAADGLVRAEAVLRRGQGGGGDHMHIVHNHTSAHNK